MTDKRSSSRVEYKLDNPRTRSGSKSKPKNDYLTTFLIKHQIVKNPLQAKMLLLAIVIICIILTMVLVLGGGSADSHGNYMEMREMYDDID